MRLILVRHYKTKFNVSGQLMGWGDSPKVDNWMEDMTFVESVLDQHTDSIEAIYSSALTRARRTAEHFAACLDVNRVEIAEQLNEINYGSLTEKNKQWVARHYPQHKYDPDFVYPQGESFRQLQQRCVAFVRWLTTVQADRDVLCVVHAGVIRALLSQFLELDYAAQLRHRLCHRYIGVLSFAGEKFAGYEEWGMPSEFFSDSDLAQARSDSQV
jgi:alpha-ribazole phosphatase